ncbi:MAG TPA: aminoacyl-tRNA hydrolase [Ignavibacteriales bacterium]|nr:aminoacyl-tRNA hydrolase [Ignavibacteriales bacterium]
MRIIVGIGNPGNSYKDNRHNVGFQFLDFFAQKKNLLFNASKFDYHFAEGELSGNPFVLVKPDTYVNNSGLAVLDCIRYYSANVEDVLVVVDDIHLNFSDIRIRRSGGDGGHNGLNSIIYHLSSENFSRLRIGIGSDFESGSLVNYVLSNFNKNDFVQLEKTFNLSIQLVESFILDGYSNMLSTFSRLKNLDKLNKESE